eukprot:600176-Rhodomonas_salina.1
MHRPRLHSFGRHPTDRSTVPSYPPLAGYDGTQTVPGFQLTLCRRGLSGRGLGKDGGRSWKDGEEGGRRSGREESSRQAEGQAQA